MQIPLKRLSINLAENKKSLCTLTKYSKNRKGPLSTKLIIFETPLIRNENIVESF